MEVEFATNRLAAASLNLSEATRLFGVPLGRKYIQRVAVLRAVEKFTHLCGHRALRLHQLRGDRTEQYAIILTGNYRLIIERITEEVVRILSVEDYHGD